MPSDRRSAFVKKSQLKIALYSALVVTLLGIMLMREFVWRYQSPFSLTLEGRVTNGRDTSQVRIDEFTETKVDTVQSEFENARSGVTRVKIILQGKADTLSFLAHGHYYSSLAPLTFSNDRAEELFLIPNTEQGLALGVGELVYLDTAGKLSITHVQSSSVADADGDSVFEIRGGPTHELQHLDRSQKNWIAAPEVNRELRKPKP